MRQFLLCLVVFVFVLIQAQVDSEEFTLSPEIETELKRIITDDTLRSQVRVLTLESMKIGHKAAEGQSFLSSFECATNGLKEILEDGYKIGEYLISREGQKNYEHLALPLDILNIIQTNDEWVRLYNPEIYTKKSTLNAADSGSDVTSKLVKADTENSEPTPIVTYEAKIKKSFKTWYGITSLKIEEDVTPPFIKNLQTALKIFHKQNSGNQKYKTIEDVKIRFAANTARSFKMMSALHHSLNNILRSDAEKDKKLDFLTIFLRYASDWYMSPEQFQFLNILRQVLPKELTSLSFVDVQNKKEEWVVLPYDHSTDCGRMIFSKLPATPKNVYSDPPISIVFDRYSSKPAI